MFTSFGIAPPNSGAFGAPGAAAELASLVEDAGWDGYFQPRIPIWVGGDSPAALRRAARWDGWIGRDKHPLDATADDAAAVRRRLEDEGADGQVEVAWGGRTASDRESIAAYRRAGATWWMEVAVGSREEVLARVAAGPPASVDDT